MEEYNSYNLPTGSSARLAYDTPFDFQAWGYTGYQLKFFMYWYGFGSDYLDVQASTDGINWITVGHFTDPYGAQSNMWNEMTVDLSAYANEPQVYLAFLGYSAYGYNMFIDDISLLGASQIPDGNPGDNSFSTLVSLSYIHDVGVSVITEPSYTPNCRDITWFTYGGDNTNAIGLTSGGTFEGAIRMSPDELAPFAGQLITTVSYHHGSDFNPSEPATNGYFKFYGPGTTTQPGALLYSEAFSTPVGADWFTQTLATPLNVDVSQDLWFSIECDNTVAGEYPLGTDAGPAVDTKADWASLDGGATWIELQIYGLDYNWNHMVGFEPYIPPTKWPPGIYHVAGYVQNYGVTFTESDIPVHAKITHTDNSTVIYTADGVVAGPLAPGEAALATFPDVTIYNLTAWEGKYKVEIWTSLSSDEVPGNDKKSMVFQIEIIDVIPPISNHTITGTMGLNGWYVSNVVITLSAYDPAPPMNGAKAPSGVHAIYYKLHTADNYTVYDGSPITVSADGNYQLYYYADDNAGNVEKPEHGPIAFKIDKTAPTITLTVAPVNTLKTKWTLTAEVADATSSVAKVEFYVDDVLVGNASAPGPYTFEYKGKGKIAQAIVYDLAGNSAMSEQVKAADFSSQQLLKPNAQQIILLQK